MKYFHTSLAVLLLFLAILFPYFAADPVSVKLSAAPLPVDTPDLFDLSIDQIKDFRKDIRSEEIRLEQPARFERLDRDLENTKMALEILSDVEQKPAAETLAKLQENFAQLSALKNKSTLTIEDVEQIKDLSEETLMKADEAVKADPCNPPVRTFTVKAIVKRGTKDTDKEFQVFYRNVGDAVTVANTFAGGDLAPATDGRVEKGVKYFWTVTPGTSVRSIDQPRPIFCRSNKEITLLAP